MHENYPILVKTYTLSKWYIQKLSSLPKNHRFTLGEKIQNTVLELLMLLSDAIYTTKKLPLLKQANKELEKLRLLSRLVKDLNLLTVKSHRFVMTLIDEIGYMLGGWIKASNV